MGNDRKGARLGSRGEVDKSSNTAPSLIEVVARSRIEIRLDSKSKGAWQAETSR